MKDWLRAIPSRERGVAALLLALIVTASILNPAFLSLENARDLLVKIAPAGIVACALTFVILAGEIDISVGSLMGLCAGAMGIVSSSDRMGLPWIVGALACLLVGSLGGLVNGLLVAYGKVPSIIVTLGTLALFQGVTEKLMGGQWIAGLPPGLRAFGTGNLAGIPNTITMAILVAAAAIWLATKTPFGKHVYALGGNERAAELAGLSPANVRLMVFVLAGLAAGIAALFSATQLEVLESGFGRGFELTVVAAVVVGGTSIQGGKGTIAGSILGAALLGILGTVLIFMRLGDSSLYWERSIQGVVILASVLAGHRRMAHARAA